MGEVIIDNKFWSGVSTGTLTSLKRSAAYIRTSARHSIKTKKNKDLASKAGKPPHNHTWLKKSIVWSVDMNSRSVVVGAELRPWRSSKYNAAHANEYGGKIPKKTRRVNYRIGIVGPVDFRWGYVTPPKDYKGPTLPDVVFTKLRTKKQVERAKRLADIIWPVRNYYAEYPERPYMRPAFFNSLPAVRGFFRNAIR